MSKARDKYLQDFKEAYFQYLNFLEKQLKKQQKANPLADDSDFKLRYSVLSTNYKLALQGDFDVNVMHYFLKRIEQSAAFKSMLHDEAPSKNTVAIQNYEFFHKMAIAALKLDDPKRTKDNKALHQIKDAHMDVMQNNINRKSKAERQKELDQLAKEEKPVRKQKTISRARNADMTLWSNSKKQERMDELEALKGSKKVTAARSKIPATPVKPASVHDDTNYGPAIAKIKESLAEYKAHLNNDVNAQVKLRAIKKIEDVLNKDPSKKDITKVWTEKEIFMKAKTMWQHEKMATIFGQRRRGNSKGIMNSKLFWAIDQLFFRNKINLPGVKGRKTATQVNRLFDNPGKAMQAKSKSKLDKAKVEKPTSRAPRR